MTGRVLLDTNIVIALFANETTVKEHLENTNDIWIAAIARQYQLTLVTRDEHFRSVDGIPVEQW